MVAILHPTGLGTQIAFDRAVVLIGRSPECDVVLDMSSKISRMHCALVQVDTAYYIRDLGSLNGVTVAGKKIEKDARLTNGVEVLIGDIRFLFLENVVPAAKTARAAGGKGTPVFVDETVEVLEVEEVEVIEPIVANRPAVRSVTSAPQPSRRDSSIAGSRMAKLSPDVIEDVEIVDAEIIDDIGVIEDIEIIDVDVIDMVEDVEVLDDVEVIDDVQIVDERPRRPRPRPPLR
jgi:pSer/pThr/pTyr-binding forkhead associated (FHA) protein